MNPVEMPPSQLVRAVLTNPNRRVQWVFPAVEGLTPEQVREGIYIQLENTPYADVLPDPGTTVEYPMGAYKGEVHTSPLGWQGVWVKPPTSVPQPPPPQSPNLPLGPLLQTPLPQPQGQQNPEQAAISDLEAVLGQWRDRHRPTSAEFFYYLHKVMMYHAGRLAALERRGR